MEEDYGYVNKAKDILKAGLRYNPGNENLIIKFLRLDEKIGRISDSRRILATLQNYPLEKTWKLYLEGALLEAKAGQVKSAKRVFKALIQNVLFSMPTNIAAPESANILFSLLVCAWRVDGFL